MFARTSLLLVLTALACAPPPVIPSRPPEAPVLENAELPIVTRVSWWRLEGSAPAGTVVRIHLDEACLGPALRVVSPEQLRQGLDLDLAGGTVNVFTAIAIDVRGVASDCSGAVTVRYDRPPVPERPKFSVSPPPPTRATHFVLGGVAVDADTVRLFRGYYCQGVPQAVLSAVEFSRVGFAIDVLPNSQSNYVMDALSPTGDRSACSNPELVASDNQAPFVDPRMRSPMPTPELRAFVHVSGDAALGRVFLGDDCRGPLIGVCETLGCMAVQVEFPATPSASFSATATDPVGNVSECIASADAWWFDPNVQDPAVQLESGFPFCALVPVSSSAVVLYDGPDCEPLNERTRVAGSYLAGPGFNLNGLFGPSDGGVISARGTDGVSFFPCSAPLER